MNKKNCSKQKWIVLKVSQDENEFSVSFREKPDTQEAEYKWKLRK